MILVDKICKKCNKVEKDLDSDVITICSKCKVIMLVYYGSFQLGTANDFIPTTVRKKREKIPFKDIEGNIKND